MASSLRKLRDDVVVYLVLWLTLAGITAAFGVAIIAFFSLIHWIA